MPEPINIEVTQPITRVSVSITTGIPGQGVPVGGTEGQVLAKASATDYHTQWVNPETGGPGGAVSSVFSRTGAITAQTGDYTADQVTESATRVFVSPTQKTELHTHANKSILDSIQEALTTILKTAYDSAVTWISTNGTNLINHLSNTSNPHSVTKSQVGLGSVDNTSDADKPISTATQSALNGKQVAGSYAATSHTHTASQVTDFDTEVSNNTDVAANTSARHTHANSSTLASIQEALTTVLKTAYDGAVTWITTNGTNLISHLSNTSNPHSVTKSQVGLGSVDNTSDAGKPVSTAQQTALDLKQNLYTPSSAVLGADVTMTTAGTWYSGPAVTLAAGTWMLFAQVNISNPTGAARYNGRIHDGTNAVASGGGTVPSVGDRETTIPVIALVSPSGSTTYTVQAVSSQNNSVIESTTAYGGQPACTQIIAKRIS